MSAVLEANLGHNVAQDEIRKEYNVHMHRGSPMMKLALHKRAEKLIQD